MKVLEVKDVSKNFYSTHALSGVSFDLEKGEVLAPKIIIPSKARLMIPLRSANTPASATIIRGTA